MRNQHVDERQHDKAIGYMNSLSHNKLTDRQAARSEYHDDMKHSPELVAERVRWLLNGDYGYGAYLIANAIVESSSRYNKVAALSQAIAAFEWQCPALFARQAYLKLSKPEQQKIDRLIGAEIEQAKEDREDC